MTDLAGGTAPICVVIPTSRRTWHRAAPGELTVIPGGNVYGHRFNVVVILPGALETDGDRQWRDIALRPRLEPEGYWIDLNE